MRHRLLGPAAPNVSSIGFGGMPLSITGRPSREVGVEVIHASMDAGVTFIDTADVYCLDDKDIGHNERLIASALDSWDGTRDAVVVGTKGGLTRPGGRWERNGHPRHLRRACEQSLAALAVDRIDLYQLHAPDPNVPLLESVGALAELQREGKIRWIGLSNVSVEQIQEAQSVVEVVTVQNRLNPFFRESVESGVVEYCGRQGIGFLAYSPVGGGRLNKKLPTHPVLKRLASHVGASAHELVLAWVLAQGETVIAIPGARTVPHAESAASASDLELDDATLHAIDTAEFSRD